MTSKTVQQLPGRWQRGPQHDEEEVRSRIGNFSKNSYALDVRAQDFQCLLVYDAVIAWSAETLAGGPLCAVLYQSVPRTCGREAMSE